MSNKQWSAPPAMQIDVEKTYHATIETKRGKIEIEFYPQYTSKTVNNFIFLATMNRLVRPQLKHILGVGGIWGWQWSQPDRVGQMP